VLLTNIYNKSLFFHLNPVSRTIHIYELDPTFSYKNQHAIILPALPSGNIQLPLYQMQAMDNLLVVHDMSAQRSQIYDMKLPDYATGVL